MVGDDVMALCCGARRPHMGELIAPVKAPGLSRLETRKPGPSTPLRKTKHSRLFLFALDIIAVLVIVSVADTHRL